MSTLSVSRRAGSSRGLCLVPSCPAPKCPQKNVPKGYQNGAKSDPKWLPFGPPLAPKTGQKRVQNHLPFWPPFLEQKRPILDPFWPILAPLHSTTTNATLNNYQCNTQQLPMQHTNVQKRAEIHKFAVVRGDLQFYGGI